MSKIITTVVNGCYWCPHHTTYSDDKHDQGRCKKTIVRKNNYKLIRQEEMFDAENFSYDMFPEWCPLENNE